VASSQGAAHVDDLSRLADLAPYAAKGAGRHCVRPAEPAPLGAISTIKPR
jgi:GGDEF domain-containing protein